MLLFFVAERIFQKTTLDASIKTCQLSVLVQSESKVFPGPTGEKSPWSINCNTRYVNIYNDRIEAGLTPENTNENLQVTYNGKKVTKYGELNEYIVNQIVAEEMRVCYFEFGEGKIHVFDNNIWNNNDVCFICSQINFKDIPNKISPRTYTGFIDFINKTYITNEKMTYYEYFNQPTITNGTVPWSFFSYTIDPEHPYYFNNTQSYAVVFGKQDNRLKSFFELNPDITGSNTLSPFANLDSHNNYYVFVVPADRVNAKCDVIAS